MSVYQCHHFAAFDRRLTSRQMAELRAICPFAEISSTRFWAELRWCDLQASPARLLRHYFDAYLHFSGWGTRRLMLRLPRSRVDVKALGQYFSRGGAARLTRSGEHVVVDLRGETEVPERSGEGLGSMAVLAALRTELMQGDLRPAYLAWLLAVQAGDVDGDTVEPPVPPGLARLSGAQVTMAQFLHLDPATIAAAAAGGAGGETALREDVRSFRRWVAHLPERKKGEWLRRAAGDPGLALGGEMLRAFRAARRREARRQAGRVRSSRASGRRTAADLLAMAEARRPGTDPPEVPHPQAPG